MSGDHEKQANSILDWWSLAGVDQDFVENSVDLTLRQASEEKAAPVAPGEPATQAPSPAPAASVQISKTPAPAKKIDMSSLPDTLDGLRTWLMTSPDVPAGGAPASRVSPTGKHGAGLMVVTAMPDAIDLATGNLIAGEPGQLFDRMLKAIGLTRDDIAIASIAMTHLPGGKLDAESAVQLTHITLRHIELSSPKGVLVLGDKASRALLATDILKGQGRLREIKVNGANIPAVAAFHPRTLDSNPQFKRAAWESLQLIQKAIAPE